MTVENLGRQVGNPKQLLPEGYELVWLGSHYIWYHPETDTESFIHWDRWAIYRSAWCEFMLDESGSDNY